MKNYLTIDVEEHFQVSAFEDIVPKQSWGAMESRVEKNTYFLLDLLAEYDIKATFFIVGWVAERSPEMVREIDRRGHEVACHSYLHRKVYDLTVDSFREDTARAKTILEELIGKPIMGYRAPSYSITKQSLWAFDVLEELGFTYDSSVFPIYHDTYGIPDAPRFHYTLPKHNLHEFPITTSLFFSRKIPVAGGGYFRLFPYWFTKNRLRAVNRQEEQPFIFYLHPWEIDPDQPRFKNARLLSRFRHYNNLAKTESRFKQLLEDFSFQPLGAAV